MARYYTEEQDGRVKRVIAQDDTGIYATFEGGQVGLLEPIRETLIKFPGDDVQKVFTTSRQYLDFMRLYERSSYMMTKPSEIKSIPGTAEEVVHEIWGRTI